LVPSARIEWTNAAPAVVEVRRVDEATVTVRALDVGVAVLHVVWPEHPATSFAVPVTVTARQPSRTDR
jgi:hypothetical protein